MFEIIFLSVGLVIVVLLMIVFRVVAGWRLWKLWSASSKGVHDGRNEKDSEESIGGA